MHSLVTYISSTILPVSRKAKVIESKKTIFTIFDFLIISHRLFIRKVLFTHDMKLKDLPDKKGLITRKSLLQTHCKCTKYYYDNVEVILIKFSRFTEINT